MQGCNCTSVLRLLWEIPETTITFLRKDLNNNIEIHFRIYICVTSFISNLFRILSIWLKVKIKQMKNEGEY
jgi:hypothetical protein